ncbi:hypothetical protein ACLBWP_06345 [Microbacterium sp. M1A1_1b]
MHVITAVERGSWLVDRVGAWGRVGGVTGTGFAASARILHPVPAHREDLRVTDAWGGHPVVESATWRWADVARRTGRTMHPLVQWHRLTDQESIMSFDDGWWIGQVEDGRLEPTLLASLTEHLAQATATPQDVVAAVWNGWGDPHTSSSVYVGHADGSELSDTEIAAMQETAVARMREAAVAAMYAEPRATTALTTLDWPGREFVLLQTTLDDLADPGWADRAPSDLPVDVSRGPQLLWPEGHEWVVASEIDWDSTIVAGSRALVDAVLADDRFEAHEVDEHSDLTWDGDHVNPRHTPGD